MIFKYSTRSIFTQKGSSLITLGVLASTTALVTVLCGLTEGLMASVRDGGDPLTAIVVTDGSDAEGSSVPAAALNRLGVLEGVASGSGGLALSPEALYTLSFMEHGHLKEIRLRGVDPVALDVHRRVRVRGRLPNRMEAGAVIGARLLGTHEGFAEGGTVHLGRYVWPVLGVLEAADSPFESELWIDRSVLKQITKQEADNTVFARLTGPAAQDAFARGVAGFRDLHLKAYSETAYYREQIASVSIYFNAVYLMLGILVISMIFISANTIYTSFLGRTRELATLMAIGYTRRRVMLIMTVESIMLTGIGGGIGVALATLAHGRQFALEAVLMVYSVQISLRVLAFGIAIAAVTGLISSLVANVQIARINILGGLRE